MRKRNRDSDITIGEAAFPCYYAVNKNRYMRNCYHYREDKDMNATIPYCKYKEYGFETCEPDCSHYVSNDEIGGVIRNYLRNRRKKND